MKRPPPLERREPPEQAWDRGWEGHRVRQARLGLRLTPAGRLRWLEQTVDEMRRLLGLARRERRQGDRGPEE
ncbi:MAG TPA: hypothetical protein VJV23_15430 [Candidatus Polarisedimenticolia bacterium]|nr:hypothetical protein [Candidatus Polarisedimenticolia bacterium]